ncbi:Uncharacterised protein [Clostridium tertium]|uniref:Uncharacterized protein n=1 Tax=Clostridium tertium TaxID=1559 RepID=A0A6N3FCD4_9CLOT
MNIENIYGLRKLRNITIATTDIVEFRSKFIND